MDSISFFWSFFKMLAALAIVIALMIVAAYFIKKYFLHSLPDIGGGALINILSTRHVSPKNSIILVEVLGQVMLVGVSGQQISLLSRIDDPAAMEKIHRTSPKGGLSPDVDALARCKSLFSRLGGARKDR